MRIRTLSAALAVALLPLTACEPPDGSEESPPPEATEVSQEAPPSEPDYGVRTMACDEVQSLVEADAEATALDGEPIQIALEDGELITEPDRAVVGLGEPLRWTSENLSWVVAFQGGLSPLPAPTVGEVAMSEKPAAIRGRPGTAYPQEETALVPQDSARCGYYYYTVAAYDPETETVHVSDPPIWVHE